jgi:hypothetical protein
MSTPFGSHTRGLFSTPGLTLVASGLVGLLVALAAARTSPYIALGAVLGIVAFGVLVYDPSLGLLLTAALVPIERVGRLTDDAAMYTVSLMRIAGLLALGALLLNRLLKKKGFVFGTPLLVYAAFVGVSLLSVTYSDDRVKSVQMALTFVGNLLFFFLILNLTKDRRAMDAAIYVWLLSTVLTGVYATYDWHFGSGETGGFTATDDRDPGRGRNTEERMSAVWEDNAEQESLGEAVRRSMGPTSHAAVFGINLILSLPFFLYALRLRKDSLSKAALLLGGVFVAYNIFLTNTRSVMITTGVVCLLCLIFGLVKLSGPRILAAVAVAGVVLLLVPIDTYNRSLNFSQYSSDRSATLRIRLAYWQAGLEIIRDHWLTGLGSGNEMAVMEYVRIDAPQASNLHNEYLQTMMEVGVIAGSVFFAFIGLVLTYSFRAAAVFRRQAKDSDEYFFLRACQVAMITVLLYGLQVDVFHFPLKGWWLIAGFVCVLTKASRSLRPVRNVVTLAPQTGGLAVLDPA